MKHSLGRRFGTTSVLFAIVTACATGGDATDMDAGLDVKRQDVIQGVDTGGQKDQGSMCGACNIDLDCENTCGAPPSQMTWCCDTSTNGCYPASQCSSGGMDAGGAG